MAAGEAGYDVVIHHHASPADAEDTARAIRGFGRRAETVTADLAEPSCAASLVGAAAPLTLLVNCASLFQDDRIETLDPGALDAHFAVNLRAPVLLAQAFAAALPADRRGLVVNITDQRVWRLTPRFFSYTLSKAALWAATQTLAQALAPRIRVNAIGPGPTFASVHQSPQAFAAEAAAVPLGRGPHAEEIGAALAWLIASPSVTGQMVAVDGGQHLAWRTPDVMDD